MAWVVLLGMVVPFVLVLAGIVSAETARTPSKPVRADAEPAEPVGVPPT